ncbi:MAG: winged helix-turn-helix transcriptional regulator [Caldilineaceae bacterium]|nr:winged helix-turn-helix transcriptional regulator [Caldilineaceae bacterium]
MNAFEAHFKAVDIDFIHEWAGGHPTLLEGVCRVLDAALLAAIEEASDPLSEPMARTQLHRDVARQLRQEQNLNLECNKIWEECNAIEQQELLALGSTDREVDAAVLDSLQRRHILMKIEGKLLPFCRLFGDFVQRKRLQNQPNMGGLWVDVESGAVLVGGEPAETLTNLEYRLVLLFFENVDKIVDKYQIVTDVWGESYLDEVDDTRIEKLISRLRQKIEPDPTSPRFLQTVRGRGYRLSLDGST